MILSNLTDSCRFVMHQSAAADALQHLVLFGATGTVAHRLLPVPTPATGGLLGRQPHLLLTEAPAGLLLPLPALDAGPCRLAAAPPLASSPLNYLRLHFDGLHLKGQFAMVRLQPDSPIWLFSPVQQVPQQVRRGPAPAAQWPTAAPLYA